MGIKALLSTVLLLPLYAHAQNEWVLRPWLQVRGGINGEMLGAQVTSITPRPNLPFKATISKAGSIGFYSLETQTDTLPEFVINGENVLTGDLNDDGFTDIVFARIKDGYDTVFVLFGNASGVATANPVIIPNENRYDRLLPGCVADVNNDGKPDLILTAESYPRGSQNGKLYFFLGPNITSRPTDTLVGKTKYVGFGVKCAVGDLDGDGLNDLVVQGAENWYNVPDESRHGYINIYWGTGPNQLNFNVGGRLQSQRASRGLAVFDVDGDGIDDLLWITRDSLQWIEVHHGRQRDTDFRTTPDLRLKSPPFASFMSDIFNGGDMNGDGHNDVVIGAAGFQNIFHYALVYSGGPTMDGKFDAAVGTDNASYFGKSIAAIGDINADGLSDILVGAPRFGRYGFNEEKGFWGVFLGDRRIPVSTSLDSVPVPSSFKLNQNYPNPFNSSTSITYSLPIESHITVRLYDVLGREIKTILQGERDAGDYHLQFEAYDLATGVYVYQLLATTSTGSAFVKSRKMLLVR